MKIIEYDARSGITKSNLPELDYAVNPYTGCQHKCIYCFAIDFTRFQDARENWGEIVYVKRNLLDLLASDIKKMKRGITGLSTITDPYQPVEARYKLTRNAVRLLLENGFRVTVQTKSPLAARDIDVFTSHSSNIDVGVTITTLKQEKALLIEQQTPSPILRARLVEKFHESGLRTWIFLGPIIRDFNDGRNELEEILKLAARTNSRLIYDFYTPYKNSSSYMQSGFPGFKGDPRFHSDNTWKNQVIEHISRLSDELGVRSNSQKDEWKIARGESLARLI